MKEEELNKITESMQNKLGKEQSAIIADDLGILISANNQTIKTIKQYENEIENLKSTNEKLITANGRLLKSIPAIEDNEPEPETVKENKKTISLYECFDKKGNFIKM